VARITDITSYFDRLAQCFKTILAIIFIFPLAAGRTPGWQSQNP